MVRHHDTHTSIVFPAVAPVQIVSLRASVSIFLTSIRYHVSGSNLMLVWVIITVRGRDSITCATLRLNDLWKIQDDCMTSGSLDLHCVVWNIICTQTCLGDFSLCFICNDSYNHAEASFRHCNILVPINISDIKSYAVCIIRPLISPVRLPLNSLALAYSSDSIPFLR